MVVVVIIGILAAIAIPSYNGFQNRAKSAEAKVQLSAIYTAEAAYFSEEQKYNSKLDEIGISTTLPAKYYDKIGFSSADGFIGTAPAGAAAGTNPTTPSIVCAVDNSVAPKTFIACAESANADLKKWSIDQSKNLTPY